ncbi:MAG: universal stress protein, partial [Myxococcales bacterium]|nr:universal stress protein [Myxococcales bacterium]
MEFKRILVPIDFSEGSAKAVRLAASIASKYDAALDVMHVNDGRTTSHMSTRSRVGKEERIADREQQESECALKLQDFVDGLQLPSGLVLTTRLDHGAPVDAIIAATATNDYDLIVMATAGKRGLTKFLLG